MWYFSWILGLALALCFGILNAIWYEIMESQLHQMVRPQLWLRLQAQTLRGTLEERVAEATRLLRGEAERPFDLVEGPLVRASLLRLGRKDHVLSIVMHHAVSDGWSMNILFAELSELYRAHSAR